MTTIHNISYDLSASIRCMAHQRHGKVGIIVIEAMQGDVDKQADQGDAMPSVQASLHGVSDT